MMKRNANDEEKCQYDYQYLIHSTLPYSLSAILLRRYWLTLYRFILYTIPLGILGSAKSAIESLRLYNSRITFIKFLGRFTLSGKREGLAMSGKDEVLNLQPGEWVQVRSAKEIFATLDEKGKFMGLAFMPEMTKFCGKRFKVFKIVSKIKLESTGELRKIKAPTVFLEGVFCDGEFHEGCDRSCFIYWREAWLRRLPSKLASL